MQKSTFIIVSKSCIVRKGISTVIHQLENTLVYDELDKASDLDLTTPYHVPDFLVVDFDSIPEKNYSHIHKFTEKFEVDIIGFGADEKNKKDLPKCKTCFTQYESEESIRQKLLICISDDGSLNSDKKSNVLSDREKNVLELVAKGLTNKEIAEKLFISLHTVITHRKNITKKLGIKTVSGLTVYAILNNIIEMKDIESHS